MKVTQHASEKEAQVFVSGVIPSKRYLIGVGGEEVREMPAELARRKIPKTVLDAHSRDVEDTLNSLASSAKHLIDADDRLSVDTALVGVNSIAKEVMVDEAH